MNAGQNRIHVIDGKADHVAEEFNKWAPPIGYNVVQGGISYHTDAASGRMMVVILMSRDKAVIPLAH